MYWAAAELGKQQCEEAKKRIDDAFDTASTIPPGPLKDSAFQQVTPLRTQIHRCTPQEANPQLLPPK
jgi:hypothetical protein